MNVLHVTRAQGDAIADGTLTLAPADGQRCRRCGGAGWQAHFGDQSSYPTCEVCDGSGLAAPSPPDPLGIAADGLLVCTVSVVDVAPFTTHVDLGDPECIVVHPDGTLDHCIPGDDDQRTRVTPDGAYLIRSLDIDPALLGPPEELVGRWAVLVKNPHTPPCSCVVDGVADSSHVHGDPRVGAWPLRAADVPEHVRQQRAVPVAAAPVGTITEEDFDG